MSNRPAAFFRFALYGESEGDITPEFAHIEPISTRSSRYEWKIDAHSHPGIFQIILLERGGGTLTADDKIITLQPSCLIAIPDGAIHAFDFAEDAEGWVLSLAAALVGHLVASNPSLERGIGSSRAVAVACPLDRKPAERFSWLLATIAEDVAARGAGALSGSQLATLILLFSLSSETLTPERAVAPIPAGTHARREQLAQRFRSMVDQHFKQGWAVTHYAMNLGTSAPTLTRACQEVMTRAPGDIILDRIMLEAMRALTYTASSVRQIGEDLGFTDPAYFTRFFKARAGVTPSLFRSERMWLNVPT